MYDLWEKNFLSIKIENLKQTKLIIKQRIIAIENNSISNILKF